MDQETPSYGLGKIVEQDNSAMAPRSLSKVANIFKECNVSEIAIKKAL